jgi:thiol-disulfide isomerase/thioredoxin
VVLIVVGLLVASGYSTLLTSSKLAAILPDFEGRLSRLLRPKPGATPAPTTPAKNLQPAPDVQFQTLAGAPFRLSELRGHVVLLNFWATWCIPCREEIPTLNSLQHDLEAQGLKVLGASLEDTAEGVNAYQKSVRRFDYEVLLGGSDVKQEFAESVLPTTYLIDRDGHIRDKIIGARDRAGWEAAVKPLLAETQATAKNRP